MVAASNNHDIVFGSGLDQSVFIVDSSRPIAGKVSTERLGFADAVVWSARRGFDEEINSLQELTIVLLEP
jgi:hypothetical protein